MISRPVVLHELLRPDLQNFIQHLMSHRSVKVRAGSPEMKPNYSSRIRTAHVFHDFVLFCFVFFDFILFV